VERGRYRGTAGVGLQYPAIPPSRADLVNDLAICEIVKVCCTLCGTVTALFKQRDLNSCRSPCFIIYCTIINTFFPSLFPSSFLSRPAAMSPSTTSPGHSIRQIGRRARRQRECELRRESVSSIHLPNPRRRPQTRHDLPDALSPLGTVICSSITS